MSIIKEIESAKYHCITGINEPEDNTLEFQLLCGKVSEYEEDICINDINVISARSINIDENSGYKVTFQSYLGYVVLNESYVDKLGDKFIGINPRIYSESAFLNYIKEDTFATKDYPGEFKQYTFTGENHVINVVSESEPEFERMINLNVQ